MVAVDTVTDSFNAPNHRQHLGEFLGRRVVSVLLIHGRICCAGPIMAIVEKFRGEQNTTRFLSWSICCMMYDHE